MKMFRKILSMFLVLTMVLPLFPVSAKAEDNIYAIQNDYVKYTINSETGGFSVETLDGNPQKDLDDNIPLLYKEDEDRSNGTSFTTIRIDGKDYVFGRSYGFFGLSTNLHTPVVSNEGRLITVKWDIKNYTVTQQVALSAEADQDLTGNVGISYSITNNGTSSEPVGIRVLLDTALDSTVDSPYLVKDTDIIPINVETEFSEADGTMPSQIRGLDSLENPSKMLYTFTKTWNNEAAGVDRVIVGHWRNLANTRYDYTPDRYCDFTNYSNSHRFPDSAIAYYWDEAPLDASETRTAEIIYGVGNFSQSVKDEVLGLNMSIDNKIRLTQEGDSYVNDGKFDVTVVIDNSVTGAQSIDGATVTLSFDEGIVPVQDTYITQSFDRVEIGDVKTLRFSLQAEKESVITAKDVGVTFTGTQNIDDSTARVVTFNAQRSLIIPGIKGGYPDVKVSQIAPEIVFTEGEKTITIAGDLSPIKAIEGSDGWKMFLYHTTTDHKVEVKKSSIAFVDDEYNQLTFSTDEELSVGEYKIGFEFTDTQLVNGFGTTNLKFAKTLNVSNNPIYRTRTYGLMALIRHNKTDYAFVPFADQNEYNNFLDGLTRTGGTCTSAETSGYSDINGNPISPFTPVDLNNPSSMLLNEKEIMLIMRGSFKESTDADGNKMYQASTEDSDIVINEILSYTGDNPLIISEKGGIYKVSGDGKLSVINSITVWPGKWHFQVNEGTATTLDSDRCNLPNTHDLELTLGGVGYMVQALGGFLIDIKYGVMTSSRPVASDRTLIYSISFGGSISIPISIPGGKKSDDGQGNEDKGNKKDEVENKIKTQDEEDYSDVLTSMFEENPPTDSTSGNLQTDKNVGSAAQGAKKKPKSDFKKDTNLDSGLLSASIDSVLFGQESEEDENGNVKITDTGFIGIDTTLALGLPKDVLGSLITNAPGVYAALTINTIDHFYMIEAGLDIKLIQCEGVLSFKMTEVKDVEVVVPDSIQFYIRDGLQIPIVPPAFYLTGLGGGIDELADTIGGEFSKLPPITLLLYARFELVNLLVGDFNAAISLSGLSIDGNFSINVPGIIENRKENSGNGGGQGTPGTPKPDDNKTPSDGSGGVNGAKNSPKNPANKSGFKNTVVNALKSPVSLSIGASLRWINPANFKGYGNVSIIDGLLTGGITITISNKSFYGYAYLSLCIPESIPIIGGKELAGLEAGISEKFVGANIKILGIKLGFIYYWGGDFSIGTGIKLMGIEEMEYPEYESRAVYGTNLRKLSKTQANVMNLMAGSSKSISVSETGSGGFMIEIPFDAQFAPSIDDIQISGPAGNITLVPDDGQGGGNFLVQSRDDGNYIYVSVTDASQALAGTWTVSSLNDAITINNVDIYGVENIPELTGITITRGNDNTSHEFDIAWALDSTSETSGYIDVYLTKDADVLEKIKTNRNEEQDIESVAHIKLDKVESGSQKITLPDSFDSGTYHVAAMLTNISGGMSTAIGSTTIEFVNRNLPSAVKGALVSYAGDGELYVDVTDSDNVDYTHYLVSVVAEDGSTLSGNFDQFAYGEPIFIGKEANLTPESNYHVEIRTLREEDGKYYYGTDVVKTNTLKMPVTDKPVLKSVTSNISGGITNQKKLELTYNFDRPVWMYTKINADEIIANDFKETWTLVYDLNDGDYVVDFTAYGENKDSISGKECPNVENAQMGFTVDTELPALSLRRSALETLASSSDGDKVVSQFGSNIVFADEQGNFAIEGLTDYSVNLTANDEAVEVGNNGVFTYEGKLNEDEESRRVVLKATDKAGNSSELVVYAIVRNMTAIERVEILCNGESVPKNDAGESVINIKNGNSATLTVVGYSADGSANTIEKPIWDILYEKNIIEFADGRFTAKVPGQTSVKGGISNGTVTLLNDDVTEMLMEDYVIINITLNDKSDLYSEIQSAETNIKSPGKASQAEIDAYRNAIDAAKAVYNIADASESEIEDATVALKKATTRFNSAKSGTVSSNRSNGVVRESYLITVQDSEHGKTEVSHNRVYSGNSLTIKSTPDEGYEVDEVLVNGFGYGWNQLVTVPSIYENSVVTVKYRPLWNNPFVDVTKDDWFYGYVRWAHESGVVNGTSDTTFSPDEALTRAMLVTILWRAENSPDAQDSGFADVPADSYYAKAVSWAKANGIVNGYNDTEFGPDDSILREQIAAIMYRYASFKGYDVSKANSASISAYKDASSVSEYAVDAMKYSVGSGLIKGKSKDILDPQASATRAESVTILERFMKSNNK